MPVRPLLLAAVAVLAVTLLLAASARSADEPAGSGPDDMKALQGRWERKLVAKNVDSHCGARAVKEISGNRETVTYLNDAGEPVYATTADFKLRTEGPVTIYTYSNLKVTQGKGAGTEPPKGNVSYIYRVEGDQYYEAHGLLTISPAGAKPRIVEWRRVKER